jgi:hypothetical protein
MRRPYIQPRPVKHFGIQTRSTIEARWIRYFLSLEIAFEYEKHLLSLPSGNYLPDFFLPDLQTWIEVKPFWGVDNRHREAAIKTGKPLVVLYGDIPTAYELRQPLRYAKLGVYKCWTPNNELIHGVRWGLDKEGQPVLQQHARQPDAPKLLAAFAYARDYKFPRPKPVGEKTKP